MLFFPHFGILCQEKSGNPGRLSCAAAKTMEKIDHENETYKKCCSERQDV
jgi:hypothetical protein